MRKLRVAKKRTETQEQIQVVKYVDELKKGIDIDCYHIPNEGRRDIRTGAINKMKGVRKGIPDLHFPIARGIFHSLYMEMKSVDDAKVSLHQLKWFEVLANWGNCVVFCYGAEEAFKVIHQYFNGKQSLHVFIDYINQLNSRDTDKKYMLVSRCCKSVVQVVENIETSYYICCICKQACDTVLAFDLNTTEVKNDEYLAAGCCSF